jgi:multidrug resistance efflux pump
MDDRISDRDYFDRIMEEREKLLDERFASQKEAINKAEQRLDGTLKGFPQEYARRMELEQMINALDETSTVLAQKVVDSAAALAESQRKAEERLASEKEKTDDRVDIRFKKLEDYQARLTGMALILPFVSGIIVYLLTK